MLLEECEDRKRKWIGEDDDIINSKIASTELDWSIYSKPVDK